MSDKKLKIDKGFKIPLWFDVLYTIYNNEDNNINKICNNCIDKRYYGNLNILCHILEKNELITITKYNRHNNIKLTSKGLILAKNINNIVKELNKNEKN